MGSKQSSTTSKEIENNQQFRDVLKKAHTEINKQSVSIIQKNISKTNNQTQIDQSQKFQHLTASGSITISGVSQDATIKVNISALSDTNMQQELVQTVTDELRAQISNYTSSTQKELQDEGEQMMASVVGGVSDTLKSLGSDVTGGKMNINQNTTIGNILNLDNEQDIDEFVKNAVSEDIVNSTINDISNSIVGNQKQVFSDMTATGTSCSKDDKNCGSIVISNISQKVTTDYIQTGVQKSGLTDSIISNFSGLSTTEVSSIAAVDQDLEATQQSTLDAAADVVDSAGDAASGVIWAAELPWMIGMGIVAVVFIAVVGFLLWSIFGGGSDNKNFAIGAELAAKGLDAYVTTETGGLVQPKTTITQKGDGDDDDNDTLYRMNNIGFIILIILITIIIIQ